MLPSSTSVLTLKPIDLRRLFFLSDGATPFVSTANEMILLLLLLDQKGTDTSCPRPVRFVPQPHVKKEWLTGGGRHFVRGVGAHAMIFPRLLSSSWSNRRRIEHTLTSFESAGFEFQKFVVMNRSFHRPKAPGESHCLGCGHTHFFIFSITYETSLLR
jgi:hypothetical protein